MLTANPQNQTKKSQNEIDDKPGNIDLGLERTWLDKLVPGYTGDGELHRIGGEAMTIKREWWQPSFDFLERYYSNESIDIKDIQKLPSFILQRGKHRKGVCSSSGVYFAFQGSKLIYIGKAAMVSSRAGASHHKLKIALNDGGKLKIHYFVVTHPNYENLATIEEELIGRFSPELNTHYAGHKSKRKAKKDFSILNRNISPPDGTLSIQLDDPFLDALKEHALSRGMTPERLAQKLLRQSINMLET